MYNIIPLISIIENGFFDKFFSPEILGNPFALTIATPLEQKNDSNTESI